MACFHACNWGGAGIVEALAEALRDKSEKVRRRAMASLGELLFYIASQQSEGTSASAWHVPSVTITLVCRMLKPAEDDIAQVSLPPLLCCLLGIRNVHPCFPS